MKVRFKVVRTETWYPECEVPDGLTDDDVLEYIATKNPTSVYDKMFNRATLDIDIDVEVVR